MSMHPERSRRAPFRLRTLGGAALERDGVTVDAAGAQRKMLALLALLAVARQRGISRERLALYLWPESDAERARGTLKQTLHVARQQLGSFEAIVGATELRLNQDVIESDVHLFEEALDVGDLEGAVALYGGPFLDGFHLSGGSEFERWVDVQRDGLARRHAAAIEALATRASAGGDHAAAVRWWRVLHDIEPLSSRITLALMQALEAAGDRVEAIRCARAHQVLVTDELGGDADPAVGALAARLRHESEHAHATAPDAGPGRETGSRALDRGTDDAEAYELYLHARHHWKLRTREGFQSASKYYVAAVERDPGFARAWAGLAEVYVNLSNFGYMRQGEALALAERSADRAIELDSRLARAHAAKGFVLASRLAFTDAEATFRRAVALDPGYSFGHHYYTLLLLMLDRTDEALARNREALRVDPLSRAANATTGVTLCQRGDYDGAARELERALALAPDFPLSLYFLGVVRAAQHAWDEALSLLERAAQQAPGFPGTPGALAWLYRQVGRKHDAAALIDGLRADDGSERTRMNLALALAALASLDEAFARMDALSWDVPSLIELRADPLLEAMRADARYAPLMRRLGADAPAPDRRT